MPPEDLINDARNKLAPDNFKNELGEDILNGGADETLEQPEEDETDIDDFKL